MKFFCGGFFRDETGSGKPDLWPFMMKKTDFFRSSLFRDEMA
jgi:hypothetical protein